MTLIYWPEAWSEMILLSKIYKQDIALYFDYFVIKFPVGPTKAASMIEQAWPVTSFYMIKVLHA